jgi:hypothetical protein
MSCMQIGKSPSKSYPCDHFMLNYGLSTKLYLSRLSGSYSEFENPYPTGQLRFGISPDKSGPSTRQVQSPGFKTLFQPFFIPHSTSIFFFLLPPLTKGDSKVIWGFSSLCLVFPWGLHPFSFLNLVSTRFALVQGIL